MLALKRKFLRVFMCCMCLLVGSPRISVHIIGIGGWLHLMSPWVNAQVTKKRFVVVSLLVTKLKSN